MKYRPAVFAAVAMATVLASCSFESEIGGGEDVPAGSVEMSFTPSIKTASRAGITTTEGETLNGVNTSAIGSFAVYARSEAGWLENMGAAGAAVLSKGTTSSNGIQGWLYNWSFDTPPQDWPEKGTVDFFAVSPANAAGLLNAGNPVNMAGEAPATSFLGTSEPYKISYQVPPISGQQGLLVALTTGLDATVKPVIPLRFQHALSRVTVAVKMSPADPERWKDVCYYTVKAFKFINIADRGSLPMTADGKTGNVSTGIPASGEGDTAGSSSSSYGFRYDGQGNSFCTLWQDVSGSATYGYPSLNSGSGVDVTYFTAADGWSTVDGHSGNGDNGYVSLFSAGDALMIMPQELPVGTKYNSELGQPVDESTLVGGYLMLSYEIHSTDITGRRHTEVKNRYIPISRNASGSGGPGQPFVFEIGRQYRFLVDLTDTDDEIHFRVVVTDFDDTTDEQVQQQLTRENAPTIQNGGAAGEPSVSVSAGGNTNRPTWDGTTGTLCFFGNSGEATLPVASKNGFYIRDIPEWLDVTPLADIPGTLPQSLCLRRTAGRESPVLYPSGTRLKINQREGHTSANEQMGSFQLVNNDQWQSATVIHVIKRSSAPLVSFVSGTEATYDSASRTLAFAPASQTEECSASLSVTSIGGFSIMDGIGGTASLSSTGNVTADKGSITVTRIGEGDGTITLTSLVNTDLKTVIKVTSYPTAAYGEAVRLRRMALYAGSETHVPVRTATEFAASNIFWDDANQRLTFASSETPEASTMKTYQGLLFKWGSLIGISPAYGTASGKLTAADFNVSTTPIYVPDVETGAYVKTSVTAQNRFSRSDQMWLDWDAVPYCENVASWGVANEWSRSTDYLAWLVSANNPSQKTNLEAYRGDICAYLSGRPGIPAGNWRLPTATEFGAASGYGGLIGDAARPDKEDGQFLLPSSGMTFNNVYFPASGSRTATSGTISLPGKTSFHWSATPSSRTTAYVLSMVEDGSKPSVAVTSDRNMNAYPVRCIRDAATSGD